LSLVSAERLSGICDVLCTEWLVFVNNPLHFSSHVSSELLNVIANMRNPTRFCLISKERIFVQSY
jgi:hypothetical protein